MSTETTSSSSISIPMLGFEGRVYVGAAGSGDSPAALTEAVNIRNVKYGWSFGEVDATLKKHRDKKAYLKGMADCVITFDLANVEDENGAKEADVALILEAARNRNAPIRVIMVDKESGEGPMGDFEVWAGEVSMNEEELQVFPCTLKPYAGANPVEWYPPSASSGT